LAFASACGAPSFDEDGETSETSSALHGAPRLKRVALSTGVELQYLEQGSPRGEPVIFIHGYTDSHHSFDLNLPHFPRDFHVYALDLRGHGDSSKPACCYTQRDFARDVVAFMDAVGIGRANLVGHSMGSFVAHRVAVDFPWRLKRLVLIGSAPKVAGNPAAAELKAAVDTLSDPIDPEFVLAFQASTFFRPIPESFLETSVSESLKVPASVWQQALDGLIADDHSARLGRVTAPTLILYGDQDVFFSVEDQRALAAAIPRSKLVVYEQVGHGTHVEAPTRTVADVARFLR
jgi:pimeloyl-ACP methyl ester carboxylesterase